MWHASRPASSRQKCPWLAGRAARDTVHATNHASTLKPWPGPRRTRHTAPHNRFVSNLDKRQPTVSTSLAADKTGQTQLAPLCVCIASHSIAVAARLPVPADLAASASPQPVVSRLCSPPKRNKPPSVPRLRLGGARGGYTMASRLVRARLLCRCCDRSLVLWLALARPGGTRLPAFAGPRLLQSVHRVHGAIAIPPPDRVPGMA